VDNECYTEPEDPEYPIGTEFVCIESRDCLAGKYNVGNCYSITGYDIEKYCNYTMTCDDGQLPGDSVSFPWHNYEIHNFMMPLTEFTKEQIFLIKMTGRLP